ncbi:uncharacterized protein LOC118766208 [Octopus sinensis]|uniref:Uncharacterized protein LOC118766208 n=1 Tax=Octopus sinensis TaxID=2607531 RepID=A0A7E6FCB4_9MOLL|nr:uncharacterized protein LOC118766208 [Octopus sinensis]
MRKTNKREMMYQGKGKGAAQYRPQCTNKSKRLIVSGHVNNESVIRKENAKEKHLTSQMDRIHLGDGCSNTNLSQQNNGKKSHTSENQLKPETGYDVDKNNPEGCKGRENTYLFPLDYGNNSRRRSDCSELKRKRKILLSPRQVLYLRKNFQDKRI